MFFLDTALKGNITFLFFLFFISCDNKYKEYADNVFPYSSFLQEIELKGKPLSKYRFDHFVSGIWVDETTKTIVATDVN